jgi:glutaconate CoA-transferase, subunit A
MDQTKLMKASEAVSRFVSDGGTIFIGGFGNLYPFALAHEVIRQKKSNLTLAKHSPELIGDQLIGSGCVNKVIFSWLGNPGIGSSHCFRRAVEQKKPHDIELEEYSHASVTAMLRAGAIGVPFIATKALLGSDVLKLQSSRRAKTMDCPFTGEKVTALRALEPDVALIHAQRADEFGNVQAWGIVSDIRDGAFASKKVIASVEEIVTSDVIRKDPNRTLIPSFKVDAVVKEPWGAHPSACQGYYDRDNDFFLEYDKLTRSIADFNAYLDKWVYSVKDRSEYLDLLGREKMERLHPLPYPSQSVDYGMYLNS